MSATSFKKVLNHPDKDKITEMLMGGISVKEVEKWISDKYPNEKSKHITWMTLQAYRRKFLNIYGDALDNIKKTEAANQIRADLIKEGVKNMTAYKRAVKNIEKDYVNYKERLLDLDKVIWQRIADHIELVKNNEENIKSDVQLEKWVNLQIKLLQEYAKLVDGKPDSTHQHNVNISVMTDYVGSIKEAIRDVLSEMSPELIPSFLVKCDERFKKLQLPNAEKQAKNFLTSISEKSQEFNDSIIEAEYSSDNNDNKNNV
jgi:hypothetical protein